MMEFPEDFNQLELLNTHGHLIPRGASSLWTGSKDEEDEVEEEEEIHSEEWYLEREETLKDKPQDLILWAAENNRVSDVLNCKELFMCCCLPSTCKQVLKGNSVSFFCVCWFVFKCGPYLTLQCTSIQDVSYLAKLLELVQ